MRFRLGSSSREPAPRSGRAGFYSQVAFPADEEQGEAASWGETTVLHRQIFPSAFGEGARETQRGNHGQRLKKI